MTDFRGEHSQPAPGVMTMRVYVIDRHGTITADTGVQEIDPDACKRPLDFNGSAWPACGCQRCARARVGKRRTMR